jgi:hypothetical protein
MYKCLLAWFVSVRAAVERRTLMQRVMCRMHNKCMVAAFSAWLSQSSESRRLRHAASLCVSRMKDTRKTKCFFTWFEVAHATVERRIIVMRCLARMSQRLSAAALSQWCQVILSKKQCLADASGAWRQYAEQQQISRGVMQKVITRVQHMHLNSAFSGWFSIVSHRHRCKVIAARCAARMQRHGTAAAWDAWIHFCSERTRLRCLGAKTVARIQRQSLCMAFFGWNSAVHEKQHFAHVLKKCIVKMQRLSLRIALDGWNARLHQQLLARASTARGLLRNTFYYFELWLDLCDSVAEHNAEQIAVFDKARKPKKLLHHFSAWMSVVEHSKFVIMSAIQQGFAGCVRGGFMTWTSGFYQRKHELELLRRGGRRFLDYRAILIMERWCDFKDERKHLRAMANSALVALKLQAVRAAFRSWADFWRETITSRQATAMQHARRLLRQAEGKALARWIELVETKKRLKYKMEILMGRSTRTLSQDVLWAWAERAMLKKFTRGRLTKAANYFAKRTADGLRECFKMWFYALIGKLVYRATAGRKFNRRVRAIRLRQALDEWLATHSEKGMKS